MSIYKQNFLSKNIVFLFLLFPFWLLNSCAHKISGQSITYSFKIKNHVPDYSDLNYWAASTFKYDTTDNVPKDFKYEQKDSIADVFFIYPTSYTDRKMPNGWNANIDDAAVNKKTDESSILYQASIFNFYCRVFAPRYRQANLFAFYTKNKDSANAALNLAYEDVKNAFEYYLKNYNHGRPI